MLGLTFPQFAVLGLLCTTMILFIWGRFRFDLVALTALLAAVLLNLVPAADAFVGFGHPAVITVAAVLVLSHALSSSGALDALADKVLGAGNSTIVHLAVLCSMGAVFSAFMNNVGALALLMPVAIQTAQRAGYSPSALLMPLAFATILGGLITLIGTPPNIIIASYRAEVTGSSFGMFDFTPVGGGLALIGMVFVVLVGWRLIPKDRKGAATPQEVFDIGGYVTEVRVPDESQAVGQSVGALVDQFEEDVEIIGLVRGKLRNFGWTRTLHVQAGDILILQADAKSLAQGVSKVGLELVADTTRYEDDLKSDDIALMEAVVMPGSAIEGRTTASLKLRSRRGVNLIAVARGGESIQERLSRIRLQAGDVLLLQGPAERLPEAIVAMDCMPIADRQLSLSQPKAWLPLGAFSLGIIATATGLLEPQIALTLAVIGLLFLRAIPLRDLYTSVDWPVIVLLGAMIPVGEALRTSGATELIASGLIDLVAGEASWLPILALMIVTMVITAVMNNAATAVVMGPIALGLATQLNVSPDPFLMAVAIGASSAFVTPIGHQNNTLVMGPGGYHFYDYVRVGLPLQALLVAVGVPLIMLIWPF